MQRNFININKHAKKDEKVYRTLQNDVQLRRTQIQTQSPKKFLIEKKTNSKQSTSKWETWPGDCSPVTALLLY